MSIGYALVTPAKNEEKLIEKTIMSVVNQTVTPLKWVIVDDGSTDRTAEIVRRYAERYDWIELRQSNTTTMTRKYAAKAHLVNSAFQSIASLDFSVFANVDADVSFEPDYFFFVIKQLIKNPKIGVIGTVQLEPHHDPSASGFFNDKDVFGACQIFRRECFEEIGGYLPLWGGVDWAAVRMARMHGWETRVLHGKPFYHNRIMGATETNQLVGRFRYGVKDYYLGNHPLWQIFRVVHQLACRPYFVGGVCLFLGYVWALTTRMQRDIPESLISFHRKEEMDRLRATFGRIWS